jgi:hypothetical protein
MANFSLGGGGRFEAYAKKFGKKAAIEHCHKKYGKKACDAMHHHGTKAAPYARASEESDDKADFPSFEEFMKNR